jgi:hypothetical protein
MSNSMNSKLAARREALVAACAQQRVDAEYEVRALLAPVGSSGGITSLLRGRNLKVPLTIAGVVLGMIAARPGRAMPIITAGFSLWKLASNALRLLRRPASGQA